MSSLRRYPTRTPDSRPPVTGVSSHSPAPAHQTLHSLSSDAPYETGSSSSAHTPSSVPAPASQPAVPAHLHVQLPHLCKERPDALVVLTLVQQHKLHIFCCYHQYNSRSHIRGSRLLPGVTNAETVHSLNLSTDLRYLSINCYPSTAVTPFLFHLHPVVPPHHILNHVQARISNHLDHMPILTPSHSNSAPLRARLHNARRPR